MKKVEKRNNYLKAGLVSAALSALFQEAFMEVGNIAAGYSVCLFERHKSANAFVELVRS